ncbi:MAG: S8 family serine peptidase [Candidatus Lokiarchaeia archaeon]
MVLVEKRRFYCFLGLLLALAGLSMSEPQLSVALSTSSYVSFSGQIVWSGVGFTIFLVGELLFFTSLLLLLEEKKIREAWVAQLNKTTLFTAAFLILVQRVSGTTTFNSPLFSLSIYLENMYTGTTQYIILISAFTTLSLVIAADFLLRRDTAESPSEHFYITIGLGNFTIGSLMLVSVLLTISNYSFYPFPGNFYFYTQHILFETVDAFEVIGVFTAALGCVIIAFKRNPPKIGLFQIIGGSMLMVLATPLTFLPVQIWIDKYVFSSPLLASFNLGKVHDILPLNLNLFTYISLIAFMTGMLLYLRVSKLKVAVIISFLVYLYSYPSLRLSILYNSNIPAFTPSIPLSIYTGLAIVLVVTARPVVSQWNIRGSFRGKFKFSLKNATLIITALLLFASLIVVVSGVAVAAPLPMAQKGLSTEDKIDPYLLSLNPVPESVPVILRFDSPVSDEDKTSLNNYDFFTINETYEENCYYAIHGSINTTGIDFQQTLRTLINDFPLSYLLYNRDPSNPPDFKNHCIYHYYLGSDILWTFNITGRGTTIAVVDSGIHDNVEEIKQKKEGRILYQVNFLTGQEGDPLIVGDLTFGEFDRHGTNIAILAAGEKFGIAPEANIIDLKVKPDDGELFYMTYAYTTEAVYWCIRNKDRFNTSVIVLAVACRDSIYGSLTEAVDQAFLNGIVVVAAGGTVDKTKYNILGGLLTPGIADWAITVAATNGFIDESWSPTSPLGPSPHWYFPKPEVTAALEYTSTSTGIVAGVALLLAQQYNEAGLPPVLRAAVIRWALIAGAQEYDLGPPGWDIQYGFGRVNALASYLFLKNHLIL